MPFCSSMSRTNGLVGLVLPTLLQIGARIFGRKHDIRTALDRPHVVECHGRLDIQILEVLGPKLARGKDFLELVPLIT